MNIDPNGNFFLSVLVGVAVGLVVGFVSTVVADYVDDGKIFNGSISAGSYIANTLVSGVIGAITGGTASTIAGSGLGAVATVGSGAVATGTVMAGTQILQGAGILSGITIMASIVGKSGGYIVKKFPNEHDPAHVHIFGDDIADKAHGIRIGIDGNPLPGQGKLPTGARKSLKKLWELILKALSK